MSTDISNLNHSPSHSERQSPANYMVVSEIKHHGERMAIPDDARNVTVQPLGLDGSARVTYLTPLTELRVNEDSSCEAKPHRTYIY